ncbi:lytic transglycosylase domain-containing protein [Methylobacillus flagellatus]|uniref:lytic transglycosylase domain-containing protein n=1 Tax=Methylobacillus flagellatus TaxID=405 RepID=UPI0010F89A67|nr:lytic transglycosylase domain-containing protein [Methylobacillus flagellatus]
MKLAWVWIGLLLISAGTAASREARADDALFEQARAAYKKQDARLLAEQLRVLQAENHLLAPYADYWLTLLQLQNLDNSRVHAFLDQYADFPFADRLRGEWLKSIGKYEDWPTYFNELPRFQREDQAIQCYTLLGAAETRRAGWQQELQQARSLWFSAKDQPAICNQVYTRMQQEGVLSSDDLWQRVRLALQENNIALASNVLKRLDQAGAPNLKRLNLASQNPSRLLDDKSLNLKNRFDRELALFALDRLARVDTVQAMSRLNRLEGLDSADTRHAYARLAMYGARKHDPLALSWYQQAGQTPLDAEQQAWKARAAMRVHDWVLLERTIDSMDNALQNELGWRYWRARALKEQQKIAPANAIFVELSREHSYYGLLAREELGETMSAPAATYKAPEQEIRQVLQLPGIQRAVALQRLDMRTEARQEWNWAIRDFSDQQLIAAAEAAARQGWLDMAINTAEKTRLTHDFALRYPTPYRETLQGYARENGLEVAWIYGLIRQESRFVQVAKSSAGASGLMQVMPATAKWIAKRLGFDSFQPAMINELETNLRFGTHYLRYTMDRMDGYAVMATAAYNAGPGRPKRWLAEQPLDGTIYAENIPFTETRDYVKKVMANSVFYAQRLGAATPTLKQRMGVIPGWNQALAPGGDAPAVESVPAE